MAWMMLFGALTFVFGVDLVIVLLYALTQR